MAKTTITIVGNVTADPELKATSNGSSLVNFSVASTERVLDKSTNQWTDGNTSFFRVTAWSQLASNFAASVRKGQEVVVVGTLSQRSYTDSASGEQKSSWEISAESVAVSLRYGTAQFQSVKAQAAQVPAQNAAPVATGPVPGGVPVAAPVVAGVPTVPAGFPAAQPVQPTLGNPVQYNY